MKKYLHYCWFGGNPLPKLANKCINSWKKYLPDYEIIEWNETNVDLEECPFIKEAYELKKWAFVADYVRAKAMYEYGGIYFDTDMEVIKPIDDLLAKGESFLGTEDSHLIACGVWYEPKPKSYISSKLLEFYRAQDFFDLENMYTISIPRILSNILKDYDSSNLEIQKLKEGVTIYPREYFYPLSYNHKFNVFTDNSCMIHYYDASWTPKGEQRENKIYRILGKENGKKIINIARKTKRLIKRGLKAVVYPIIIYRRKKSQISEDYLTDLDNTVKKLKDLHNSKPECVVFVNPHWLGVFNATTELFDVVVPCAELLRKKDINKIYNQLKENDAKMVVMSGFCIGWSDLATLLHKSGIIVKTYYHGSHSQVLEPYGWNRNMEIYHLAKKGIITQMSNCKESLLNFYRDKGCNITLLRNRVVLEDDLKNIKVEKDKDIMRIGIYAAKTEDYRKNVFSQMAASALLGDNVVIDMVPLNKKAMDFAKKIGVKIEGVEKPIPRKELLKRMAKCNIVLYTTFSECAPMLPLESFAVGTPCISGNNHHYFKEHELEKYLIVDNECNIKEIADKIKYCLANEEKVKKLYKEWEKNNIEMSIEGVKEFTSIRSEKSDEE